MSHIPLSTRVTVIGGGFTGATLAYHLARSLPDQPIELTVIEPRDSLGQGLAYSTTDPNHRINVPAARMTMDVAEPGQMQQWILAHDIALSPGTERADGALFPQRRLVGDYVAAALAPLLDAGRVQHLRARAMGVAPLGSGFRITLEGGRSHDTDWLVIATSHPLPGVPREFTALKGDGHLITDPSDAGRITQVAACAKQVLVVGTGLTSADVIASLDAQGMAGQITALSRRGLRSRGHAFGYAETGADFAADPETTTLGLLRRIRRAVREDAALGLPWQAALDRVRSDGPAIWTALPQAERAKLVRRLRVWWDVHRFRIAPQVEDVLDRRIADGSLHVLAAHLVDATAAPGGIRVTWQPRRAAPESRVFDAVVLTTGPGHDGILGASPLMQSLAAQGLVSADPLGLGLQVQDQMQSVGADGQPVPRLLVAGPLARGDVGELMGIPEVTAHAQAVAAYLAQEIEP